ncbi:MAG: response regulator, partial [Candidatus Electrothrix sp. AUS4]|nr:response regulator [Candidatus Electrothrix sp. AUS4]
MLNLLIVDDSALMRRVLREVFAAQGDFEIASCRDGKEAVENLNRFQPDVILLDVVMPRMDGLEALSRIMVERPTPVVMLSSLTEAGALPTLEALALGAVDFIAKPSGTISLNIERIEQELIEKVRTAAKVKLKKRALLVDRMRADRHRIRDEI